MRELGLELKRRREALGIDLQDLQTTTKIRRRYLEAIEEGDWRVLPGDVYARGFVRSYAEALGLDGQELLDKYTAGSGVSGPGTNAEVQEPADSETRQPVRNSAAERASNAAKPARRPSTSPARSPRPKSRGGSSRGGGAQVAVVVGALVVLGAGWYYFSHQTSSGKPDNAAVGNVAAGGNTSGATSNQTGVSNTTANTVGNDTSNSTGNSTGSTVPAAQVVTGPFQGGVQTYSVTGSGPMTVQMTVTGEACWISSGVDGQPMNAGGQTVQPGAQPTAWTATQKLTLRLGHVQGVMLTINGQSVVLPATNTPITVIVTKSTT